MSTLRERFTASWEQQLEVQERKERERARLLPKWRTRQHRRRFTLVLLLGNLVIIGAAAIVHRENWWLFAGLWFGGFAVWMTGFVLLRILTGRMSTAFSALLDERERDWRHRVNYVGYQAMFFVIVVAFAYLMVINDTENAAYRGAMMLAALMILGSSVPTVVLGWSLPDDDPEDFIEPAPGEETDA
ncbi:hypothetical protein ACPZ19_25090 [Amycolatopsis lurida]